MAFFNYAKKELSAKIVYYGPGLSGKTTNLEVIHRRMRPDQRGKLISLDTQTDRTLFFDFLPLELGEIRGFKTRFHIYTVPGQVFYNATRKVVLKGVDGIVFVADTQRDMLDSNIMSFKNCEANLEEQGRLLKDIAHCIQYNKRDLPDVSSIEELQKAVNRFGAPYFEAAAISEKGVLETLTAVCKIVLKDLKDTHEAPAKKLPKKPSATAASQQTAPPPRVPFGAPPPPPQHSRTQPLEAPSIPPREPVSPPPQPETRRPPAPFAPPPRAAPRPPNPMLEEITFRERPEEPQAKPVASSPPKIEQPEEAEESLDILQGDIGEEGSDVVFLAGEEAPAVPSSPIPPQAGGEESEEEIGLEEPAESPPSRGMAPPPTPPAAVDAEPIALQAEAGSEIEDEIIAVSESDESPQVEGEAVEPAVIGEPVGESPGELGDSASEAAVESETLPEAAAPAAEEPLGKAEDTKSSAEPPEDESSVAHPAEKPAATGLEGEEEIFPPSWGPETRIEISRWGEPARVSPTSIRVPLSVSVGDPAQELAIEILIDIRAVTKSPSGPNGSTKH